MALLAAGVMVAVAAIASGPPQDTPDQGSGSITGAIHLPTAGGASAGTEAGALPSAVEGLDACDGGGTVPCARWVQPGPGTSWAGPAPVTRTNADVLVVGGHEQVRGLDASSGRLQWTATAVGSVPMVRHVGDGTVLVQDEEAVRALDLRDGKVRWSVESTILLRTRADGAPVPHVLLGSQARDVVTSHAPRDGTVEWTMTNAGMPHTFVPLRDGLLLVGTKVIHARTGRLMWDTRTPVATSDAGPASPEQVLGRMPLAVWPDGLLVAQGRHQEPTLFLREAATGAPIAELAVEGSSVRAVAVVHDHLVVRTDAATIGYVLADGQERWRRDDERGDLVTTAEVTGPYPGLPGVTVPAQTLALRLPDGSLLQLDERTGQLRQRHGEPNRSGIDLGDGLMRDGLLAKLDNDEIRVFDLPDGELLLDAPLSNPEIITTSPFVILSGGRLIGITLTERR